MHVGRHELREPAAARRDGRHIERIAEPAAKEHGAVRVSFRTQRLWHRVVSSSCYGAAIRAHGRNAFCDSRRRIVAAPKHRRAQTRAMNGNRWLDRLSQHERLNFLLTNRIPRRYATLFMGWFSRIEQPLVRRLSLAVWQAFGGDLRLHEAERADFKSMHDCFTRRLKPGARPIDPDPRIDREPVRRRRRRARADSRHRGVSGQRASLTRSRSCSATPASSKNTATECSRRCA